MGPSVDRSPGIADLIADLKKGPSRPRWEVREGRPLVLCGCMHSNSDGPADHTHAAPREPCSVSGIQSLEALHAATGDFGSETWNVGPNNDPLERSQLAKSVPTTPLALKEATYARGRRMSYAGLESVDSFSNSHDTLKPKARDTRCRFPSPFASAPHVPPVPSFSAPDMLCPPSRLDVQ